MTVSYHVVGSYAVGSSPHSVTTADLGNGQQDIIVADAGAGVDILMNQGNGSFAAPVSLAAGSGPYSVTTADLGNGRQDIIVADAGGGIDILMNQGNGSFAAAVSLAAGDNPYSVTTADLGNGQRDIIAADVNGGVDILMNQGNGSFAAAVSLAAGGNPESVTTADLGNGRQDIIVADLSGGVDVLMNQGGGSFAAPVSYAAGQALQFVTTADLGNGKQDLIVADSGGGVDVLMNQGNGSFAAAVSYAAGPQPVSVTTADLGNGRPDLIVADRGGGYDVLMNQGNGSFAAATSHDVGFDNESVTSANLTGSSIPDIVLADYGNFAVDVLGTGPGITASTPSAVEQGQTTVLGTVSPDQSGDTLTLSANSYFTGTLSLGAVQSDGTQQVIYTAPASITASGTDSVSYVVTDSDGTSSTSSAQVVTLDAGPTIAADQATVVEQTQTTVIGTVTPGEPGDTLSISQTAGSLGTVTLGAVRTDGTQQVIYTAPASVTASGTDSVAYSVTDQHGGVVARASATVTLDGGPSVAAVSPSVVEKSQTTVIGTVTPGEAGDSLTLTQAAGGLGTVSLGEVGTDGTQQVLYTAPASVTASGTTSVSYTIVDQHGAAASVNSATVTLDAGPAVTAATPGVVEQGQTTILGTVRPGEAGDTLRVSAEARGTVTLGTVQADGTQQVIYTAPSIVPVSGSDGVYYRIVDQHNVALATGTTTVTLDRGPTIAAAAPGVVEQTQTTVIGTVTPGEAGDTLSLRQDAGGLGTVSLGAVQSDGTQQVIYTAPATVAASGTDTVSYSVTDQHGGVVANQSASVSLDAGPSVSPVAAAVEQGQTAVIGIVTPGASGDTLTLAQASGGLGTVQLGAVQSDGTQQVIYTAPAAIATSGHDTISYSVSDQHSDVVSAQTIAVTLDAGPVIVAAKPGVIEQGQSIVLGTVTPGVASDALSVSQAPGALGAVTLGTVRSDGTQQILYTAPATITATATDTVSYSIVDQHNLVVAHDTASVSLDGGPTITPSTPGVLEDQGAVLGTVRPGVSGDALSISASPDMFGSVSLGQVQADGSQQILYAPPGDAQGSRVATFTYTITDQHGTASASQTASLTLDGGPVISTQTPNVLEQGQTTVLATVAPGEPGDTLSLRQTGSAPGSIALGAVQSDGTRQVIYTAPASIAATGTASVSYEVSDQHGVVQSAASAEVTLAVTPFAGLVVAADANATLSVSLTLDASSGASSGGSFLDLGAGSLSTDGNTYTVSGTAAQVNASLHALGFTSSMAGVTAPTFQANLSAGGTSATLYGVSGADRITGSESHLALVGNSAGAVVSAPVSGGDILVAGGGGEILDGSAASSGDVFFGAAAGSTFKGGAGHDTFVLGGGDNTVTSGAGGSVVFLGGGANLVQSHGADTIVGGGGNDTIDASAGSVVLFAGSGTTSFIGDAARSTVIGGAAALTVNGGAGGGAFYGSAAGNNLLQSGTGNAFLVGAGNGDQLIATGTASDILVAGAGNETLNASGSAGADLLYGGRGADAITLGSGADTLLAGSGSASVTVGSGSAMFDFAAGHGGGAVSITGFDAGKDHLALFGYGNGHTVSVSGGNTTLALSDGTHITLVGVAGLAPQSIV